MALLGVALVGSSARWRCWRSPDAGPGRRCSSSPISAYATVGASTGITPTLSAAGQYVIVALMFLGRIGSITLATALALRERRRLYDLPEERVIVG